MCGLVGLLEGYWISLERKVKGSDSLVNESSIGATHCRHCRQ